jgi:thiamine biosynthesis lipoprotein
MRFAPNKVLLQVYAHPSFACLVFEYRPLMKSAFFKHRLKASQFWSVCALCLSLWTANARGTEERYAYEKAEMGLPVRVTLYAPDEPTARAAADRAFKRVEALNTVFSDYDSDSELSRLSDSAGSGTAVPVGPELWRVLEFAQRVAGLSQGAFDITVGPVVNLWRVARRKRALPNKERLEEALGRVGYLNLELDTAAQTALLRKARMRLDAGGIAKGYAMEEAIEVLRALGHPRAMVAGGGDIALGEPPPGEVGWRIEVIALDAGGAPAPRFFRLANCSVATSGDLYQRLEIEGRRYSHIVDPRTGIGLTDHSLVTVVARRGIEADALSKVLAVLGPGEGIPIVEGFPDVAAYVVRAPGELVEEHFSTRWKTLEPR